MANQETMSGKEFQGLSDGLGMELARACNVLDGGPGDATSCPPSQIAVDPELGRRQAKLIKLCEYKNWGSRWLGRSRIIILFIHRQQDEFS